MDIVDRMRSRVIGPQDCEDAAVEIEQLRATACDCTQEVHADGKKETRCGSAQMMREIERLRADNLALRMALRGMVDTADRVDLDRPTFGECKAMRDARAALVAVDG